MKDHPTLKRGDPVLIYGRWLEVLSKRDMGFETQGLYRLQAGRYVLVSGKPIVLPTATLRPGGG